MSTCRKLQLRHCPRRISILYRIPVHLPPRLGIHDQLTMSRVKAALGRSRFFTTPSPIAVDKSETGSPLDTQQPISWCTWILSHLSAHNSVKNRKKTKNKKKNPWIIISDFQPDHRLRNHHTVMHQHIRLLDHLHGRRGRSLPLDQTIFQTLIIQTSELNSKKFSPLDSSP